MDPLDKEKDTDMKITLSNTCQAWLRNEAFRSDDR